MVCDGILTWLGTDSDQSMLKQKENMTGNVNRAWKEQKGGEKKWWTKPTLQHFIIPRMTSPKSGSSWDPLRARTTRRFLSSCTGWLPSRRRWRIVPYRPLRPLGIGRKVEWRYNCPQLLKYRSRLRSWLEGEIYMQYSGDTRTTSCCGWRKPVSVHANEGMRSAYFMKFVRACRDNPNWSSTTIMCIRKSRIGMAKLLRGAINSLGSIIDGSGLSQH